MSAIEGSSAPLSLLLDENISSVVADALRHMRPDIPVVSIHAWHDGAYMGVPDSSVLRAAYDEGKTLVTYDVRILSELAAWFDAGIEFAGLIVVDRRTIPREDLGLIARSLAGLWDRMRDVEWRGRIVFLTRPSDP